MKYSTNLIFVLLIFKTAVCSAYQLPVDSSYYDKAKAAYNNEKYPRAIKYYKRAYEEAIAKNDTVRASININGAGVSHKKIGQYDSAIYYYVQAALLDSLSHDDDQLKYKYRNLGAAYRAKGDFTTAVHFLHKALEISIALQSEKDIAGVNNSLGNVFHDMEQDEEAIRFFSKSLASYRLLENSKRIAVVLNNIGSSYASQKKYEEAIAALRESYQIKNRLTNRGSLAYTMHNLGRAFLLNENLDSAIVYLRKAYEIREEIGDKTGLFMTGSEMANYYVKKGDLPTAWEFLENHMAYGDQLNSKVIVSDQLKVQADAQSGIGNYKNAYELLNKWSIEKDSALQHIIDAFSARKDFEVSRMETLREISEERAEDQLVIIKLIVGGFLILIIAIVFMWFQQRRIKNLNLLLHTLNKDIRHRKNNDYQRLLRELEKTGFPATDTFRNMLYASVAVDEALYDAGEEMIQSQTYFAQIIEELKQALNL
ncbi:MAG: tetratricopeptide repeat protein, partial [Bacteroidota bacterium]